MNHIIFQIQDDLATITLNRPEVANGFHIPMCEEILEALELAEKTILFHLFSSMQQARYFQSVET